MTPLQARALDAIRRLTVGHVSPSLEELGAALGLSNKGGVHRVLSALKDAGLITWQHQQRRSIVIIEDAIAPAVLLDCSDDALKRTAAIIAGILADRIGDYEAATTFKNIGVELLKPRASRAA